MLTAVVTGQCSHALIRAALREPLSLTLAVLVFGGGFRLLGPYLAELFAFMIRVLGQHWTCFCLTLTLGILAGFITAVVAALVFVEAISFLRLDRSTEVARLALGQA